MSLIQSNHSRDDVFVVPCVFIRKVFLDTVTHCAGGSEPLAYTRTRSSHDENSQICLSSPSTDCGRFNHECSLGANRALAGAEGQRLVRATALARGKQLRSQVGHQSVGDVAGGDLRS